MLELKGRKVIVLGLGETGMSMARWLKRRGAIVSVADTRADPPHAAELGRDLPDIALECGEFRDAAVRAADLIAISPGIDRRTPAVAAAIKRGTPVIGDIELFAQFIIHHSSLSIAKLLAITGTNGKSTVTRMAGDICAAAGLDTVVAGNIGTPVLGALIDIEDGRASPDVFVLELSSFQLESATSLDADAATLLNLSADHLDRYAGIDAYVAAKARIFNGSGAQVLNRDDARSNAMALPGRTVHRFGFAAPRGEREWGVAQRAGQAWLARGAQTLMPVDELPVAGMHNVANALAAGALCRAIGVAAAPLIKALRNFKGLPHRVEKVAELDGVTFYDDSKGTNVGSTVAALDGLAQPVVLIAGGDGKGQDFGPLHAAVKRRARAVVLIGRDREQIAAALGGCGVPLVRADDMVQAVASACAASRRGDAVLLSPACASYDMFRNYMHRGEVFAAAVRNLVQGKDRGSRIED
jgi:UDP-N-acetylmuramoylalanine--D-glutamate ligase